MKTLKESLLGDLEDNMKAGDDIIKNHKKAEKDYKKLLTKTRSKFSGCFCNVKIKSPELAEAIAGNHPTYRYFKYDYVKKHGTPYPHDIDTISIVCNCHDAIEGEHRRNAEVRIEMKSLTGRMVYPIIIAAYDYTESNEDIHNGILSSERKESFSLQDCAKIVFDAFYKKYKDIESIANSIEQNTVQSAKIN